MNCTARGHHERGCTRRWDDPPTGPEWDFHIGLMKQGFGVSTIPGPDNADVAREGEALGLERPAGATPA